MSLRRARNKPEASGPAHPLAMDDQQVGAVLRAIRRHRGLRQLDVAMRAGLSQTVVSDLERGHLDQVTLGTIRRAARALEVALPITPRWRGGDLARLLDAGHAGLVEGVVATLQALGWEAQVERSFNHFGERGSIDVLAWLRPARALLIIEVKTRLVDLQDLMSSHDRKVRVATLLAADLLGNRPLAIGRVVVVADTSVNRRVVASHRATFAATYPARTPEVRSWLAAPSGPLAGLWFLPPMPDGNGIQRRGGPSRVRVAG